MHTGVMMCIQANGLTLQQAVDQWNSVPTKEVKKNSAS